MWWWLWPAYWILEILTHWALLVHLSVSPKRVYFHSPGCIRVLTIPKKNISTGDPLILQYQLGDQDFNFDTSFPALTQTLTAKPQTVPTWDVSYQWVGPPDHLGFCITSQLTAAWRMPKISPNLGFLICWNNLGPRKALSLRLQFIIKDYYIIKTII